MCHATLTVGSRTGAVPRRFGVGFQPPPPRTERADFQHSALLPASPPSLWDVSRRERFRSWFYPTPTPRLADLFRLPLAVYPLTSGPADYWAFLSCAPASPTALGTAWQQGSFAPRTLLRFSATPSPSATVSPSATFPVSPVI